jgi:putative inorganic carbon (hco3(-)) transporter
MYKFSSIELIKVLFAIMLFFTPLVFTTATEELFEFPKMYFLYIMGVTIIYIFVLSLILNPRKLVLPHKLLTMFLVVNIVSSALSTHHYTSLWGYYSRFNDGLISILVLFGLYIVFTNTFKKVGGEKVLMGSVFSLLPIGLVAIYQHYTIAQNTRVYSTLGQANWLGAYIAMLIPLAVHYMIKENVGKPLKFCMGLIFVVSYAGLWFTYSLSGILGLIAGVSFFVFLNKERVLKQKRLLGSVALICLLFSLLNPGIYMQRVRDVFLDVRKVSAQEENAPNQLSDPGYIRTGIWLGTLEMTKSNLKVFTFGTGPETFPYEFQRFRPNELNYSSEWNFILNKPHNYYLEILVETGIFSLIIYLAIVRQSINKRHIFASPMLLSFYVTNFFGFPTVATALLFYVLLGKVLTADG